MQKCFRVSRCQQDTTIDADWDKPFWQVSESADLSVSAWQIQSEHLPCTYFKLRYSKSTLYVIFQVHDCFVHAAAAQVNGEVWKDSCVEFFFAPDSHHPSSYFNIETNCCGVILAQHHVGPRQNSRFLNVEDCRKIRIAGTVTGPIRQEIAKPLTWTVEYAVPLNILAKYAAIEKPAPGVFWRANFYKCADDSSHPHWRMWSPVHGESPDFHQPEYFGILQFV